MSRHRAFLLGALTASACVLASACSGKTIPAAGVMVAFSTDMSIPKDVDTLEILITQNGVTRFANEYAVGAAPAQALPATLMVLPPTGDPTSPVQVRVVGLLGGAPRVLKDAIFVVPTDRVVELRMPVEWLCEGSAGNGTPTPSGPTYVPTLCTTSGQTCAAGNCVTAAVDSSSLPPFNPGDIFGGGSATGSGGSCFDTLGCFSTVALVAVDSDGCTIAAPTGGAGTNVAVVVGQTGEGICDAEACLVPLDANSPDGWTASGGTIQLPSQVCSRIAKGEAIGVATTTTCPTKSVSEPTCGPWSSVAGGSEDAGGAADAQPLGPTGSVDGGDTVWPPPPTGGTAPTTTSHLFAIHHIHLGDEATTDGSPGWQQYGYDLDGLDTAATSTNVCTLAPDAPKKNQTDGPGGIDNSWGENVLALIAAVAANPSATLDVTLAAGKSAPLIDVTGLSTDPAQTANGLSGFALEGAAFAETPNAAGSVPTFTTADDWPIDPTYLTSSFTDAGVLVPPIVSTMPFSSTYVVGGELVGLGTTGAVTLVLEIQGAPLALPIQHAVVTFQTTSGTGGLHAASGIIAGVIRTTDLVAALQPIAGSISESFCSAATFQQIATNIQQSSDIMVDGTNAPGTACDGISIGIGFDADEIGPPQVVGAPAPTQADPCADGGN